MAKVAVRTGGGGGETSYEAFPADTYYCEINQAELVDSQFKDDKTGEPKQQIKITWEVYQLTGEQSDAGLTTGKWFWQWLEPYYGPTKNGPSKFQAFIDSLVDQGLLAEFDAAAFDTDDLIGARQKVAVEEYKRADGTMGNKVRAVLPLKPTRRAAPAAAAAKAPPPPGVTRKGAPPMRNPPVAVEEDPESDVPF